MIWKIGKRKGHQVWHWTKQNPGVIIAIMALFLSAYTALSSHINTVRSERGYVAARAANLFNFGNKNKMQAYVLISNSGKTLAQISAISIGISVLSILPERFEELRKLEPEPGRFTAWPNQPYITYRTFGVISDEDVQSVMASKKRIFVFGVIDYEDIFGWRRRTTFCHMYFGSETAEFPSNGGRGYAEFQARYCDRHNDAS